MSENSTSLLKQHGLKVTNPRLFLIRALMSAHAPISAEDLWRKISRYGINLTTVYRTLHSFTEKGLVKRIDLHADSVLYEFSDHHHHHIVCTRCGIIEDFETCMMPTLTEHLIRDSCTFAQINEHSLELFGICNSCADKGVSCY